MFTMRSEGAQAAAWQGDWREVALPLAGEPGDFAGQLSQVRAEVERFIAEGADAPTPSLGGVSPEAGWLRQRLGALEPLAPDWSESRRDFVRQLLPHAQAAARQLGVAPDILLAHAALESGWGKRPLTRADGSDTFNFFGLKAGAGWRGEVNLAETSEYVAGRKVPRREAFRAYPDPGAAFADYAAMLAGSPRYRAALGVGADAEAFAGALARGGYATDPAYAGKLAGLVREMRAGG
nr:glucosaminidase domain-containing protein [Chromobacterium sp. ASV5]